MGVTFEDMVRKSMRTYWLKANDHGQLTSTKNTKYTKSYFDSVEKEMLPQSDSSNQVVSKVDKKPKFNSGIDMTGTAPSGPIPGENYTSDTKNYPWHRPPEVTSLDQGVELSAKQLMSEEGSGGLVTMLKSGVDIASLTDIFVTSGIGTGKWTPDLAILLAGPVSHIIYLMAKGYGIQADLGIDLPRDIYTHSYVKAVQDDKQKFQDVLKLMDDPAVVAHIEQNIQGIMGAAMQRQQTVPEPTQSDPPMMRVTMPNGAK